MVGFLVLSIIYYLLLIILVCPTIIPLQLLTLIHVGYGVIGTSLLKFVPDLWVYLFLNLAVNVTLESVPWMDMLQDGSIIEFQYGGYEHVV